MTHSWHVLLYALAFLSSFGRGAFFDFNVTSSDGAKPERRKARLMRREPRKRSGNQPLKYVAEEEPLEEALLEVHEEYHLEEDSLSVGSLDDLGRRRNPCQWDEWEEWDPCTVTCGVGTRPRLQRQDARRRCWCHATKLETEGCETAIFCPVHCEWTPWTDWTMPCSKSCATGKQTMTRSMIAQAEHGGMDCKDKWNTYQERACNEQDCPQDCTYGEWAAWSECTGSCGGHGTFQRAREVITPQEGSGEACPGPYLMSYSCNTFPCPVDCEVGDWGLWGNCTENCGGGEHTRIKPVITPASGGGLVCDPTEENRTCNLQMCEEEEEEEETCHFTRIGACLRNLLKLFR